MTQPNSIRYRLYSVFVFFLFLVFGFGFFSIDRLRDFNAVTADVRERWLPNTRFLGDLNNYTSDFRAAEGSRLIAATPAQIAANMVEVRQLDQAIAIAARSYEGVRHDRGEAALYARFKRAWIAYRGVADRVFRLAGQGQRPAAATMYMTASRKAYDLASDTLGELTDRNVTSARHANELADAAYRQAVTLTTIAIAFAALMVAAAVLYIRRSISEPLLGLAHAMRGVAENHTDIDIPGTERPDEVGEMARAVVVFRNNAIDLAVSQRGLAQQASMLREKLEQEQKLAELQRNFVSMASHEFRTPLTIIDAHAQRLIAAERRLNSDEIASRAGKIRGAVLRMTNLIEGLLGSSLLEGKVELYFHPAVFDLAALLHEVCRLHREITPSAQIYERVGNEPIPIIGDRKLLFQVFSNLLSNAVKYSPDAALIRVSAAAHDGYAAVKVEDSGLGIPEADLDHLFERYYRGSNVSGIVGTGIGLHFVKMVTELHGGSIAVESIESKGATFLICLPVAARSERNNDPLVALAGIRGRST